MKEAYGLTPIFPEIILLFYNNFTYQYFFISSCHNLASKSITEQKTEQDLTFYENELVEIIDSSLDCIELHLSNISSFSSNTIQNISYIKSEAKLVRYSTTFYIKLCYERDRRYCVENEY